MEHFIFSLGILWFIFSWFSSLPKMEDFLGGGLLFDPIALVSVHYSHERMWWEMGLCTSEASMLTLQAEVATPLCLSFPVCPCQFQPGRVGVRFVGEGRSLFVVPDNGDFQSA